MHSYTSISTSMPKITLTLPLPYFFMVVYDFLLPLQGIIFTICYCIR